MTEQQFSHIELNAADSAAEPVADVWRGEVQSRIARYKSRRGRRVEGAFSMRFPFPADEIAEPVAKAEAVFSIAEPEFITADEVAALEAPAHIAQISEYSETTTAVLVDEPVAEEQNVAAENNIELVLEPTPVPEREPYVDLVSRPRPKRKVIAFPKHLSVAPESLYRLADPVTSEVPRILDVPEELQAIPTTPFLDGLELDSMQSANELRDREHVELPFQAVRVSQRIFAGIIDAAISAVGVVIFGAVAYKIIPQLSITKPLVLAGIAIAGLLWSVYQYLFVVYSGRTLGMMAAKIRLRTFKGFRPTARQRRARVLGFYLSALSLGMGLMWVFVDVDGLCWHDRLSRTYLSNRK
jgi:uncharacterized RDD family membrane protein YckC